MTAYRNFTFILSLTGLLLFSLPLPAAEPADTTPATPVEAPKPQSHEAIKQMADELEADRKAREAAAQEKREMGMKDESDSSQTTTNTNPESEAASELKKLKEQCDDARETLIAPLREAAIQECIDKKVKTPEECEKFYQDYGNAGATQQGGFRQRMFHDIPQCQPYYKAEKNRDPRTSR